MKKLIYLILPLLMFACESMEDTYDEFDGDGKIRYVGKVLNLEAEAGWERIRLSWDDSLDPTVKKIKIEWSLDDVTKDTIIDASNTTFTTNNDLLDATYLFNVYTVNTQDTSLKESVYIRPFTETHESVQVFYKLEKKYYFMGNDLKLLLNAQNEDLSSAEVTYYVGDEMQTYQVNDDTYASTFLTFENINTEMPVMVSRSANIEGCFDMVEMTPYSLDKDDINLNPSLRNNLKIAYNLSAVTNEFVRGLTELNLDYDMESLDDLLYFENLQTLTIGANRYFDSEYTSTDLSTLEEKSLSLEVLNLLHDQRGLAVKIYNNHYGIASSLAFATSEGNPTLPDLNYLSSDNWTLTCDSDIDEFDSGLTNILDNDVNTHWKPVEISDEIRTHEFLIDMKSSQTVNGFLVRQAKNSISQSFLPETIEIFVSVDNINWTSATERVINNIGVAPGESILIGMQEAQQARYVKFQIKDKASYNNYTYLADFLIY